MVTNGVLLIWKERLFLWQLLDDFCPKLLTREVEYICVVVISGDTQQYTTVSTSL